MSEQTLFPGGNHLNFTLRLGDEQSFDFVDNDIQFNLKNRKIENHKPSKIGLIFDFPMVNDTTHRVVFEVDIKKSPLGKISRII